MSSIKAQDGASRERRADWQLPEGVDRGLWDYVNDEGVAANYDEAMSGSALFAIDVPFVLRHAPVTARLIDLGCGTGRLIVEAAKRGHWAVGVDLSTRMLAVARERARREGVDVPLLQANLTRLDGFADRSFDVAACLFSTLGMVRGVLERRRVVEHAFRILKPGGRFVLHVHNRWHGLWDRAGRRVLFRNLIASMVGRAIAGDAPMPVHQGIAGLTLHLFTRREACRLLRNAGFRIVELLPIGTDAGGKLRASWWFPRLRAYGYLLVGERPSA